MLFNFCFRNKHFLQHQTKFFNIKSKKQSRKEQIKIFAFDLSEERLQNTKKTFDNATDFF